ncbi:hypothetical protein ASF49_01605 [Methylobacterium sp. Leaf104]|uniref:helix-turn-helix domain-containing protein n=1 Tax=Methylobacterium TaxID=407 RepID=UPI000701E0FE|nr:MULTISPECIES: helix-turn-helix domain-containing protein [Methylobacterium]KQP42569.1 hypothetical protein ASF49_01605 [Methylobacterium sp. Leaf104]MCI9878883.1 helix-turn-helix domain-containing protein [Methylobacterium goesingense]
MFPLIPRGPDPGSDCVPVPEIEPNGSFDLAFGTAFTLQEVAEKLGISPRQVQALVADGLLATVNVGRGRARQDRRVLDDDLDDFVRRRKSNGSPLPPRHLRLPRR